jgi:hypothetical protein
MPRADGEFESSQKGHAPDNRITDHRIIRSVKFRSFALPQFRNQDLSGRHSVNHSALSTCPLMSSSAIRWNQLLFPSLDI